MDNAINPEDYLVLIVDDEESIRSMLGEAVAGWGFQVATAANGEAAIQYINSGNIPHIVLTDIRMGGMDGLQLAAAAKKVSPEIEVVIMTSHGSFDTAVEAMRLGVFDYISKPFDNIEDVRTSLLHVAERIYLKFYTEFLLSELERKNGDNARLAEMGLEFNRNLDLGKCVEIGVSSISQAFTQSPTVYFQYVPKQKALVASARRPETLFGGSRIKFPLPESALQNSKSVAEFFSNLHNNMEFQMLLQESWNLNPKDVSFSSIEGEVPEWQIKPLLTRDLPRGVFACLAHGWQDEESTFLMDRYIQTIATAFENALLHAKVVQTAIRDSLTGLFNVRHFKDRFKIELQAAQRLGHPLSLLFFDVDHFKKYNDTHGHPAGDMVLRMLGEMMRKGFRTTDLLARYGGEEFVVLMPHTAFVDALEKAEKFRHYVETTKFPNEETQPLGTVSVSIGVAEYPSHGSTVDSVIKAADDALYEAKRKSRNVVVPGIPAEGYVPPFKSKAVRSRSGA